MGRYAKGLKPTTPHRVAHRLGAHTHPRIAAALAAGPKGSAMLDGGQVTNQGSTSCCHSHAAASALWTAFHAAGKPLAFFPSPKLIAATTYADVRSKVTPPGLPLPKLTDDGAELQDDADALKTWGIAPIQAPTSDGRYSDCENDPPDGTFPEPDAGQLQIAGSNLIDGEYAILVDNQAELVVAASLDAGIPVWEGGFVDTAYEDSSPSSVAQPPNEYDPQGGGHSQFIRGYRTNAAGKREYLYQNSWGSWALNGCVWVSASFIASRWSLFPMSVVTS